MMAPEPRHPEAARRRRAGRPDDVDLYEINEAFAVQQVRRCARCSDIDPGQASTSTAAPSRSGTRSARSGARVLTTLVHALQRPRLKRGIAALCLGGGNAVAMAVERMGTAPIRIGAFREETAMEIRTIGVVGAGQMGGGIAQVAAEAGHDVVLCDLEERFVRKGLDAIRKNLDRAVEKGKVTAEHRDAVLARIKATTSLDDLSACDLVIEAVLEELSR